MMTIINSIFNFLNHGWVGIIIGAIISLSIYFKSKEKGKPVFLSKTLKLIGKDNALLPNKVKILFDNQEVESLWKSYIIFWNNGNKTIRWEDIVSDDRLRVDFSDNVCILDLNIIRRTNHLNKFEKAIEDFNKVTLKFDFIESKDGIILEILHTGEKDNSLPIMKGTIIGIPQGINDYNKHIFPPRVRKFLENIFTFIISAVIVGVIVGLIVTPIHNIFIRISLGILLVTILGIVFLLFQYLISIEKCIPKKLRIKEIYNLFG